MIVMMMLIPFFHLFIFLGEYQGGSPVLGNVFQTEVNNVYQFLHPWNM